MSLIPCLIVLAIALGLAARALYVWYLRACWEDICVLYIVKSGEHHSRVTEYTPTLPIYRMALEFWVRDFRDFIINVEGRDKVLDFFKASDKVVKT